jgi:ppGpp synthetase/RelA/SpoT-type nucleotidyltranferase
LLNQEEFMKMYSIAPEEYDESLNWGLLTLIHDDFFKRKNSLERQAEFVANTLRMNKTVHTVRSRVKDPDHLIEKLIRKLPIRKKQKGDNFLFTVENYLTEITDLIGVRAIHIFKEDWKEIHDFIHGNWTVIETTANVREGDDKSLFEERDIETFTRPTGYRSVHYLIEVQATKVKTIVEIQVRTIFEEGYGEIDHLLRYPHNNVPDVLAANLLLLNRMAGSADEMASFINLLRISWDTLENDVTNKNEEIKQLKEKINKLKIKPKEKQSLVNDLDKITSPIDDLFNGSLKVAGISSLGFGADGALKVAGVSPPGFGADGALKIAGISLPGFGADGALKVAGISPPGLGADGALKVAGISPPGFGADDALKVAGISPPGLGADGALKVAGISPPGFGADDALKVAGISPLGFGADGALKVAGISPPGLGADGALKVAGISSENSGLNSVVKTINKTDEKK